MNRQGGSNNLNDPKDLKDLNDPKDLNKIKKGCKRCACSLEGGGYLLSHFRSTIGVAGFNFSVRNGKRWNPRAITTLIFVFSVSPKEACDKVGKNRLIVEPTLGSGIRVTLEASLRPLVSSGGLPRRKGFGRLVTLG